MDVYVIPTEGGEPTRLTWHPGDDIVRGFTPDGKVLFSSQRAVFSRRHAQFFTVAIAGGVPGPPADPDRRQGGHLARREIPGLHAPGRDVPPVEELSRRHGLADLGPQARRPVARGDPQARRRLQRHRADVDRRDGLLPLRSRRGVQPVLVRSRLEDGHAMHPPRRLPDRQRLGRGRQGRSTSRPAGFIGSTRRTASRTGSRSAWPPTSPRPGLAMPATPSISASVGISPSGKRAVLEYRGEIVTVPAKKGDSARPDRDARRPRTLAGLVAGRQVDRVFLRRDRRISVGRPPAGRQGGRPVVSHQGLRLLRTAGLVARQQEDRLHGQRPHPLLDRPGHRRRQADRRRADLRTEPGLADALTPGRPTRSGWPIRSSTAPASRRSGSTRSIRTSPTP